MNRDSRLSSVLHVLLHMAHSDQPLTSGQLASYLSTNPVLVRRVLANLRELGYVSASKGHGGGWVISCDLNEVTLHDIYTAVGAPTVFAMGNRVEHPECLVEQAVNSALNEAFLEAEALLVARLSTISLADLSTDFNRRYIVQHKGHAHV
ncbi:DNA-binding transcriptional regulator, IscR family [Luteibacter sp. UNC138MFCol5.1]|uniref:Rrf2 family transcriptional regulator n=1 Tax=Luteibacter sp. UNC138MFCol5.1 TaxID=1502774 RepID=UPI0008D749DA|nr:Rrf2 family transcriptional regulator [Luteibacter sp. UNC138MFCol5.1]SEO81010.1 DNA-binding transcriptional regulator, IscR family [Luteibacter sp. UNC138MFCol5.1]